jgi:hypothetical protein
LGEEDLIILSLFVVLATLVSASARLFTSLRLCSDSLAIGLLASQQLGKLLLIFGDKASHGLVGLSNVAGAIKSGSRISNLGLEHAQVAASGRSHSSDERNVEGFVHL